ncbi:hypothetical protein EJB05_34256 [Eragrostis curvula]|uniref:Uncharacterized protein n=1 Tax=Eragrostis curvula TaxID=38414 RepID=A0A5J9U401_9POAL|nr:hypothetical protein EJB05_34256 [Eragrostis curvula]
MPRYDDRYGNTRLYVGKLAPRTRSRDLEYIFSKYGRIRDVEMKRDYAFIEFSDPRDADDAQYNLDGRDVDGSRIIVEFARGVPRGPGGSREYMGRGPPPGTGRCFNCGIDGHWARDCKAGDWKNKCYRCGERGHIERNCQNSPRSLRRERSYSRSPSPRRGRGRSYSRSLSRSRSYSRSRSRSLSGSPRGARRDRDERRSRSLSYSRSPRRSISPSEKEKERSPTPDGSRSPRSPSPRDQVSPTPKDSERNGSDRDNSPPARENSRNRSLSDGGHSPAANGRSPSPMEADRRNPSPRDNRSASPGDNGKADDDDRGGSPRGSGSP